MSKRKVTTVFDNDKPKDNTKPKKILTAVIILLAITALILATVFAFRYFGTQHFVTKDGGVTLINNRTDITYKMLAPCPYTVNIDFGEVYGEIDGTKLYKILYKDSDGKEKFFDPEKMLATADEFGNVDLYLAKGYTLPTLDELNLTHGKAYYAGVNERAAGTLAKDSVQTVVTALKNGENTVTPSDIAEDSRLNLYLIDPEHPQFWYTVEFFETYSGDMYIRDRAIGKCVEATEQLRPIFTAGESEAE